MSGRSSPSWSNTHVSPLAPKFPLSQIRPIETPVFDYAYHYDPPHPLGNGSADSSTDDEVEAWAQQPPRHMGNYLRPFHRNDHTDYRLKIDIPFFDGHLHIEDFLDWLKTVETFFKYMEVPVDKQVKLVAYKLKGGASAWWDQLLTNRHREGKRPIRYWHRMRQLLKARFLPLDYQQRLFRLYHQCQQREWTV